MRLREAPALAIDACFRAVSVRPLAGLRVGLPLLLLVHLLWVSSDLLSLHGGNGIIPWELTDLLRDPWVPGLPTLASALLPLGIGAHTAITFLLSCYAGGLLALARLPLSTASSSWPIRACSISSSFHPGGPGRSSLGRPPHAERRRSPSVACG